MLRRCAPTTGITLDAASAASARVLSIQQREANRPLTTQPASRDPVLRGSSNIANARSRAPASASVVSNS